MNDDLKNISLHMRDFGLYALAHANYHANYHSFENANWSQLSVIQAAHAAEILIKARIAQEHPLLIFEHLPKSNGANTTKLELQALFEQGRTYQYQDLPERLWAATGLKIPDIQLFNKFGKLRNTIQHFTYPEGRDLSQETLEFIFGVIDPLINESWGLFAIDYNEDDVKYAYFAPSLISRKIAFLVSPDLLADLEDGELSYEDINWPSDTTDYVEEMQKRLQIK